MTVAELKMRYIEELMVTRWGAGRLPGCGRRRWVDRIAPPRLEARRADRAVRYAGDVAAALGTAVPGMAMRTVAPLAVTVPPCRSAVARTIARPSPEPGRPRAPGPRQKRSKA